MGNEEQRLARIEAKQAETIALINALSEKMDDAFKAQEVWKGRIDRSLYGNGERQGLLIEVALLKDALSRSRWYFRAVAAAVITMAVGGAWSLLS